IEKFFRFIRMQPLVEQLKVLWVSTDLVKRYLMGSPGAFDRLAVDEFWAGPAFGRAQDEHRPARARCVVMLAGVLLDAADFGVDGVEGLCHAAVHVGGVGA